MQRYYGLYLRGSLIGIMQSDKRPNVDDFSVPKDPSAHGADYTVFRVHVIVTKDT